MDSSKITKEVCAPAELVTQFINTTKNEFNFLSTEPDFTVQVDVKAFKNGYRKVKPEEVDNFFFVNVSFKTKLFTVTVEYGDRDLYINTKIMHHLDSRKCEYSLWEWLEACGVQEKPETYGIWVKRTDKLQKYIKTSAKVLKSVINQIGCADSTIFNRLDRALNNRISQGQEEMLLQKYKITIAAADKAFKDKRFSEVIELLEPIRNNLSEAEIKKLEYAYKHSK